MAPTLAHLVGFESQADTTTNPSGTPVANARNNPTGLSFVAGRLGGFALQVVEDGVTATNWRQDWTATTDRVAAGWFRCDTAPVANSAFMVLNTSTGTSLANLAVGTTGLVRAQVGGGTARTTAFSVADGEWHFIEFHLDTNTTTHTLHWQVDGVAQTNATNAGTAGAQHVRSAFGSTAAAHNGTFLLDDWVAGVTVADYPISQFLSNEELWVQGLTPTGSDGTNLDVGFPSNPIVTDSGSGSALHLRLDDWATGAVDTTTYITYTSGTTNGAASNYSELTLGDLDAATTQAWAAQGEAACFNGSAGTNSLTVRVTDSGGTTLGDVVAGSTNTTGMAYYRTTLTEPGAGWLADAPLVRVGFSSDTNPLPRCTAVVVEVATAIGTTQTVTVGLISQAGSVLAPAIVGQHSVSPSFIDNSPTLYAPSVVAQASFRNSFDNGTTGATITTGNSATSGDAFGGTGIGAGATLVYEATNTLHGAHSAAINPAAAVVCYMEFRPAALAEWYGRIYVKLSALPAGTIGLFVFRDSATAVQHGYVSILTTGQIRLLDANAATVATTTATLTAGSWSRIECRFLGHASAGVLEAKLFNTVESTTATETISGTGLDTNGTIDRLRFGQNNNPAGDVAVFYVDEPYFSPTGYPGPWTAPAQTVTVGLIDQSATVYAPSAVTQTVVVGLISQPGATFTPQVIGSSGGAQSVALPTIGFGWGIQPWSGPWGGGGASPFTLSQIKQNVVLGLLSNAGTALIHTVNPNRVNLSLISYVGVPFEPAQITQTVVVGLIDDAATAYEPVVQYAQTVTVGLISQAPTVYAMQFTPQTVTLTTTIDHGTTPFAPTIIVSPALSFINQSGTTFAPTIVAGQTVTVGLISNPPTVYDPTIAQFATQTVTLALLDNAGVVFEFADAALPGGQDVTVGLLSQAATAHEPRVYTVVPGFIHKKGIYRPTISKKGSYQPTIGKKGRFIA
jgi:hypothetical protein